MVRSELVLEKESIVNQDKKRKSFIKKVVSGKINAEIIIGSEKAIAEGDENQDLCPNEICDEAKIIDDTYQGQPQVSDLRSLPTESGMVRQFSKEESLELGRNPENENTLTNEGCVSEIDDKL